MRIFPSWRVVGLAIVLAMIGFHVPESRGQAQSPVIADSSTAAVAAFKADPAGFMAGIVANKGDVGATVASLIAKDPTVIISDDPKKSSAMAIASKSMPDQEKAFVNGIANAAKTFVAQKQQETFTKIQIAVAGQFDAAFQADFTSVIADIRTTALAASGGAGGGAIDNLQSGAANSGLFTFSPELVKNNGPGTPQVGVVPLSGSVVTRTIELSVSPTAVSSF